MPDAMSSHVPPVGFVSIKPPYSLYLLLCKGDVIYTGITNDVVRRYQQHCDGVGAKFTRSRPPKQMLCHVVVGSRSDALKLEYAVKQLPRAKKLAFVQNVPSFNSMPSCAACVAS